MIPYKLFERMCDLQLALANTRHDQEKYYAIANELEEMKESVSFPWKMDSEQSHDWNLLCQRIDKSILPEVKML